MSLTEQFMKFSLLGAEWVMWLLVACSVLSLSIIVERVVFFSRLRGDFPRFVKELGDRLSAGEGPALVAAWCSGMTLLEARVVAAGLERAEKGLRSAEEAMNATIIASRTRLDRGLTVLGTLGTNTPFLGLLGTVIGIIQAFHAMATNKSAGPEVVMASVSEALVATAIGLMVAVPAVVAYNILLRTIKKKIANSETVARIVITHLGGVVTSDHSS